MGWLDSEAPDRGGTFVLIKSPSQVLLALWASDQLYSQSMGNALSHCPQTWLPLTSFREPTLPAWPSALPTQASWSAPCPGHLAAHWPLIGLSISFGGNSGSPTQPRMLMPRLPLQDCWKATEEGLDPSHFHESLQFVQRVRKGPWPHWPQNYSHHQVSRWAGRCVLHLSPSSLVSGTCPGPGQC